MSIKWKVQRLSMQARTSNVRRFSISKPTHQNTERYLYIYTIYKHILRTKINKPISKVTAIFGSIVVAVFDVSKLKMVTFKIRKYWNRSVESEQNQLKLFCFLKLSENSIQWWHIKRAIENMSLVNFSDERHIYEKSSNENNDTYTASLLLMERVIHRMYLFSISQSLIEVLRACSFTNKFQSIH